MIRRVVFSAREVAILGAQQQRPVIATAASVLPSSGLVRNGCGLHVRRESSVADVTETRNGPAYLDMQATTPVDPRVLDAMLPFLQGRFGNPHSRSHVYGWDAEEAIEKARRQIASLIGADPREIFFTSGATESNNMAIKGIAEFYGAKKKHIVTTQTEHKCVLASCRRLEVEQGWDITYLRVDKDGLINLKELEEVIRPDTALVSVMHVNNEIGVQQPMEEIGRICADKKVFLHTDAAQSVGKIPVDVGKMNASLMSISAHKMYGPKGIGALYVRRKPRVRVRAIIDGGGQERGMRSGTLATPIVVGFGEAAAVCEREMDNDKRHVDRLFKRMYEGLTKALPKVELNGSFARRYNGNVNLSFACVEGESLLMSLANDTAVSSGSACTSASLEPSYVLRAIGVNEELAHTSLRFGIGRFSTEEEVDRSIERVVKEVTRLREMSPLWELEVEAQETGVKQSVVWS
jgi:cysteine desulfurase